METKPTIETCTTVDGSVPTEPINIDALGAEIDAASMACGYGTQGWAKWIRDWPEAARDTREDTLGLIPFLRPFAARISAAGRQALAERGQRRPRSESERERDEATDALAAAIARAESAERNAEKLLRDLRAVSADRGEALTRADSAER